MLLAFFAISSGCGGSSSSSSKSSSAVESIIGSKIILGLDSSNNDKPNILDFDGIQQLHSTSSGTEIHATVPFMFWMASLPSAYSPDIITTELIAGVEYTFELSRNFAESLGGRIPDIEILDPSGNEITATHSVYPEEQPAMILYTFTPSVSGTYTALVCNADGNVDGDTDCVLFVYREMHNSAGENGYYAQFIISDEDGSTTAEASIPEIIQLRKDFLKAYPDYLAKTYGEHPETVEVDAEKLADYYAWMSILKDRAGIVEDDEDDEELDEELSDAEYEDNLHAAAAGTQIKARVTNVPYVVEYELGTGLMATTNLQPLNERAIEEFSLNVPTSAAAGRTDFKYLFISSKEEYEQKMGRNFKMGLATDSVGVNSAVQSSNNLKFGLTTTNLVIHYEELESRYRSLPLKDYKLTDDALQLLSSDNRARFREEYGDYFVAGYQYGGMYEAHIAITTDTTEQLEKVKTQLGLSIRNLGAALSGDTSTGGINIGAQFSQTTEEILTKNNARISVEIKTIGAGKTAPTSIPLANSQDISAMGNVAEELAKFRNSMAGAFTPTTYVPVNVEFKRYRSLPGLLTKIDGYIPVDSKHSANIMSFNSELIAMRGYYNIISSLPLGKMDGASKDEYSRKYNAIMNPIETGGNAFYASAENIANTLPQVIALSEELKTIGDRYAFYNMLMHAQEIEPTLAGAKITSKPFGENGGSSGYKSFGVSAAVTSDMNAGQEKKTQKHEVLNVGWKEWYPELDAGDGFIHCWINVLCKNPHDNKREVIDSPAVGKRISKFYFQTGYDRDCEWYITHKTMRFNRTLYPFGGLK